MSQNAQQSEDHRPRTVPFHTDEAHDVTELLARAQHHDFPKVAEWLASRPEIAEVVLREANSVNHALLRKIVSLEHALSYLGLRGLERLAAHLEVNRDQEQFRRRTAAAVRDESQDSGHDSDHPHRRIA